jgi:hypothetical protein
MRFALALVLALFFSQAVVYPAAAALEVCAEACPDDRPDGTCDPTCADCTCCGHTARPLAVLASAVAPPTTSEHTPAVSLGLAARAAEPRDVFHVPRPLA